MRLWKQFWMDESGFVLSSEAVLVGTVGVVGASVGLSAAATSLNDELKETAFALRSLDQSYEFEGRRCGTAWTAGSSYTQPPVDKSLDDLQKEMDERERGEKPSRERMERRKKEPRPRQRKST